MVTGNDSPIRLGLTTGPSVDPAAAEHVIHVGHRSTWMHRVLARLGATDTHVPDDDVFEILHVDSDTESAGEVCAAKGVTLGMYCVWKRKYGQLDLDQLRAARRRELRRARVLTLVASGAIAFIVGFVVMFVSPSQSRDTTVVLASAPLNAASLVPAAPSVTASHSPSAPPSTTAVEPAAPAVESVTPPSVSPIEPGYKVQVAAAPTLEEATALIQKLTSAGHSAYLSRAIVRDVEVFRVRVGPLETLADAELVTAKLKKDGFDRTWIAQ